MRAFVTILMYQLLMKFYFQHYSRTVELLLKYGASPSKTEKQGFLPIHYASLNGHKLTIEMVSYCLCSSFINKTSFG